MPIEKNSRQQLSTRAVVLLLLLPLAVVLGGCNKASQGPQGMGPPGMGPQGDPKVTVATITAQNVTLTTELAGRVSATQIADVQPQITGIVKSRNFVEGSEVKAGQVLYQIDPASYQAEVNNAEATLAKQRANQQVAKLKADRYRELIAARAISQQDADDALASLQQAEADVAAAQASLDTARINLGYTRIVAPISGRIGKSTVTAGALITANQTDALATIQQLNPVYVDVSQSSSELMRLKRALASGSLHSSDGQTARVQLVLEDGSRYPQMGKLKFSDVTVNTDTDAVTVRAEFPNPKGDLLPGMFVRAQLEEGVKTQALLVSQAAVTRDNAGHPTAYVVNAEQQAVQRQLQVERAIGNQWLVTDGLSAGERVVIGGGQKIRDGQKVIAEEQAAASADDKAASSPASSSASSSSAPSSSAKASSR